MRARADDGDNRRAMISKAKSKVGLSFCSHKVSVLEADALILRILADFVERLGVVYANLLQNEAKLWQRVINAVK